MGWTVCYRPRHVPLYQFIEAEVCPKTMRIVDRALVGWTAYYAAAEFVEGPKKGKVIGIVVALKHAARDPNWNFGFKGMEEGQGPCEDRCPKRILDLLSPVDDLYSGDSAEWAKAWRERCRERIAAREARPKIKEGDTIVFAEPIKFSNGELLRIFTFIKGARLRHNGFHYRVTNWRERKHGIIRSDGLHINMDGIPPVVEQAA